MKDYQLPASNSIDKRLAILGIAETATETLIGVQLHLWPFERIEQACRASVYWPQFVALAKAGEVPEDWLPGALGRVVLGWAAA